MPQFSSEDVRRIWERVQKANAPVTERPDLCTFAAREQNCAVLYRYLARKIPGNAGNMLLKFSRQEQSHAAAIRGMCAIRYGKCPPISNTPVESAPVAVLLRRCYGQKIQAIAEYEKLAQQEQGKIFQKLLKEEQLQLQFLLQLLGTIK